MSFEPGKDRGMTDFDRIDDFSEPNRYGSSDTAAS